MKRLMLCAIVAGSLAATATSTSADSPRVKIGTLTCRESSGWGLVLGSSRHVDCVFSNGDQVEHYAGAMNKLGADIGYKSGARIVWAVIAPSERPTSGALAGTYVGATASATAVLGLGAHALVGGFDRSIALQPLSVEGNGGLDVAAGVGELRLRTVA
jgi:hypothetical protein